MASDRESTPETTSVAGPDLLGEAAEIGHLAWIERSLFEVFGRWSMTETEPSVVVMFDDHSQRHAWHAEVLFDRLPELADVDREGLVVAASPGVTAAIERLADTTDILRRFVAAYRVMCPFLIVGHRRLLGLVDAVSSPSTHRWIGRIIDDLVDEWMWGEDTIRGSIDSTDQVAAAAAHQTYLESLLLGR